MSRVLFVGQKPETVDFSDPALPPDFNAEKINAGIAIAVAKIGERGWQGDTCMITPDEAGRAMLEKALEQAAYDCVVIGGGLRIPPKSLTLFEMVVNAVHTQHRARKSHSTCAQRTLPKLQPASSMAANGAKLPFTDIFRSRSRADISYAPAPIRF